MRVTKYRLQTGFLIITANYNALKAFTVGVTWRPLPVCSSACPIAVCYVRSSAEIKTTIIPPIICNKCIPLWTFDLLDVNHFKNNRKWMQPARPELWRKDRHNHRRKNASDRVDFNHWTSTVREKEEEKLSYSHTVAAAVWSEFLLLLLKISRFVFGRRCTLLFHLSEVTAEIKCTSCGSCLKRQITLCVVSIMAYIWLEGPNWDLTSIMFSCIPWHAKTSAKHHMSISLSAVIAGKVRDYLSTLDLYLEAPCSSTRTE